MYLVKIKVRDIPANFLNVSQLLYKCLVAIVQLSCNLNSDTGRNSRSSRMNVTLVRPHHENCFFLQTLVTTLLQTCHDLVSSVGQGHHMGHHLNQVYDGPVYQILYSNFHTHGFC